MHGVYPDVAADDCSEDLTGYSAERDFPWLELPDQHMGM